ncbi:MAG: Gfo/Idh/MocA family oxidoreductase, partial [Candidatus Glassbacteria bacterium]|nr:Gfo/Idh/MocA family oxidoreductase [Candidatus Glassbacteria bacterium]
LNNSHPYLFGGLVNGGVRKVFERNSPEWTHALFPQHDWPGFLGDKWRFTKAWARDRSFAESVAGAVKVAEVVDTLAEAAEGTEAAFVCDMWGEYHREQAVAFLEQGKSVFVDKPLAESTADARAMIEAAQASGAVLSTCSSLRFVPEMMELKKKLAAPLGPAGIVTVCCPCHQDLARYSVHGIELLMDVVSPDTVVRLRNIGTGTRRHLLLVEFAGGTCGVIHSWEDHAYSLTVSAAGGHEVVNFSFTDSTRPMAAAVLESFESGIPVVPYDQALEVVRIIEAGAASRAAGGKVVELETGC